MIRRLLVLLFAVLALGTFGAEAFTHYGKGAALSLPMLALSLVAAALSGWLADRPDTEAFTAWLLRAGREARQVAPPPFSDGVGGAP